MSHFHLNHYNTTGASLIPVNNKMEPFPVHILCIFLAPVFLLFQLIITLSVAQSGTTINLGSSITAGDNSSTTTSWLSSSGEFAFGFRRVGDDQRPFLLAIWFDKIPDKTVVWYAKGDDNINLVPVGSKIQLTRNGILLLTDPQGQELWKIQPKNGTVVSASLLDVGNFVLRYSDSSLAWQSFQDPTDTILPSQTLELGDFLSSRQSDISYSRGRFQLLLKQDGNLVLNALGLPTNFSYKSYYSSDTSTATGFNTSGLRLVFDVSGLYVQRRNGERYQIRPRDVNPTLYVNYRATLDPNGVFSLYSHPKGSSGGTQDWTIEWSIPDDICRDLLGEYGSGACGFNSYCVRLQGRPTCECPTDYSFINPNDMFSGCKPNFPIGNCEQEASNFTSNDPEDLYSIRTLENTDWPLADYEQLWPFGEEACRKSCLHDCLCAVAIFRNNTCWKKKLPLSNGKFDRSINCIAFIKVGKSNLSHIPPEALTPPSNNKNRSPLILLGSLLGSSVFFNFVFLVAITLVIHHMYHKKAHLVIDNQQEIGVIGTSLRRFTYKELEEATEGFREEIGRGAFGIVYKGVFTIGSKNLIAVKKLDKMQVQEGEKEFKTEVSIIGKTHHKNLVQLLGFCQEGPHRLLVYEFMSNGSLANFLFGDLNLRPNWYQRCQIVLGIARGLTYLHEECSRQIIHCDIKPQNILLDDYFTARISDFGLAKLLMKDQTRTLTDIRGTRGYVATEWFRNTHITAKVDVYSFGVVLLEIVSCRKCVESEVGGEERSILTDWAYDCYREGRLQELVENDEEALNDIRKVEMLVMVAIWCIQEEPSLRPSMKNVMHMLEGVADVPVPPCPSPQSTLSFSV